MIDATREQTVVGRVTRRLHIAGEWRDAATGATFPVEDPATGDQLCEIADAGVEDARAALAAAVAMQEPWAAHPPRYRSEILWRAYEAMNERAGISLFS